MSFLAPGPRARPLPPARRSRHASFLRAPARDPTRLPPCGAWPIETHTDTLQCGHSQPKLEAVTTLHVARRVRDRTLLFGTPRRLN